MRDTILVLTLAALFATAVTTHLAIVIGLARRAPRWRAAAALFVPVLAPAWAFAEGMRVRAWMWTLALVGYAVTLALAR